MSELRCRGKGARHDTTVTPAWQLTQAAKKNRKEPMESEEYPLDESWADKNPPERREEAIYACQPNCWSLHHCALWWCTWWFSISKGAARTWGALKVMSSSLLCFFFFFFLSVSRFFLPPLFFPLLFPSFFPPSFCRLLAFLSLLAYPNRLHGGLWLQKNYLLEASETPFLFLRKNFPSLACIFPPY